MNKELFSAALLIVLGHLFASPLQAMKADEADNEGKQNGIKESTVLNRSQRDYHLGIGNFLKAADFAAKVVNEDPEASYNEDAGIEDFRCVRNIYSQLAKNDPYYLNDAVSYAEAVTNFEDMTLEDIRIARDLILKTGNYKNAAYYNDMLPENQ